MFIKGLILGTLVDNALKAVWKGAKAVFGPMAKSVADKGVDKFGEEVFNKAKDLLDKKARDEQLLSEAKLLLSYTELQAWHEKFGYVDRIAIKADGSPDLKRAERLREFLRRLTIKESVEQTAEEMRYVGGMPDEVWQDHLRALDIEHKYEHPRFDSFKAWTTTKAETVLTGAMDNRTEVNGKIEQTARDLRSWVDGFLSRP